MFYLEFNLRILHFFNFIISEFLSDEDKIICDYVIIGNYRYVTVLCNDNSVIVNYVITPFCGEKGKNDLLHNQFVIFLFSEIIEIEKTIMVFHNCI